MRDILKWIRPAVGAAALAAVLLAGWAVAEAAPEAAPAEVVEPLGGSGGSVDRLEIEAVELTQEDRKARLTVTTDGSLVWTTYRDMNGDLVVELPNSAPGSSVRDLTAGEGLVEEVQVLEQHGLTRIVVSTRVDAEHSVVAEQGRLFVELTPVGAARAETPGDGEEEQIAEMAAPAVVETVEPVAPTPEPAVATVASVEALDSAPIAARAPQEPEPGETHEPAGIAATQLHGVEVATGDGATTVRVSGDGEFYYTTMRLNDPSRFVIDLLGVMNLAPNGSYTGRGAVVERVRVAQYQAEPELVSRVVVDLIEDATPELTVLPDSLLLTFSGAGQPAAPVRDETPAPPAVEPRPEPQVEAPTVPAPPSYDPAPQPVAQVAMVMQDEPVAEPMMEEVAAEQMAMPAPSPAPVQIQLAEPPTSRGTTQGFAARDVSGAAKVYYGEPMTLSVKDSDIQDLLRAFAQLSGLNIIVQPGVRGTVTVEFTDVPWDQALEQILKINSLGYEIEGNVMRIAPINTLRQEAEEEDRLRRAQASAVPLTTIMKRVSYATAGDISRVLRSGENSVLSSRGSVVVDARTNTLIITELPQFINTVISVIETLDIPEPQVMIEARIIETTKRFARRLGIQWGFDAISSAATGNTTGLVFPNNGAIDGSINLGQPGDTQIGITLGNVLNTFNLDVALQAAENEGLINILSAPKITTLNNESAQIQSGLQIPIQTVANNTVSVQFVNATLRLRVTPHVTAEGTVLMEIDIQKREPLLGLAVQGAPNAPISTKDARTRVIVRDGGTTVIGGIYEVTSDEGQDRVPGLSKVPLLKHLFRNNRVSEENEELLIFITPRVVKL